MLIRKNSKQFKAIRNILLHYQENPARKKQIQLFITKAGHALKDRISVNSLEEARDIYYDMTYETILSNLDAPQYQLHESPDQPGLYFFHRATNKLWDETPFTLDESLRKQFDAFVKMPEPRRGKPAKESLIRKAKKKEPENTHLRPAVKRSPGQEKEHRKSAGKKDAYFPEYRLKEKSKIPHVPPVETSETQNRDKSLQPGYRLKHPIRFTDLKKLLFPELHLSKKDVLDYYNEMADRILPYLKDRLVYIEKTEAGSAKDLFPEWARPAVVREDRNGYYVRCQDKTQLLLMVEKGCTEITALHASIKSPGTPGFLVLDLYACGTDIEKLATAALTAKKILDGIAVPAFIKTSGSKGFQICISLESGDYETAESLAAFICQLIHLKAPDLIALSGTEEQTTGKVCLGFSNNTKESRLIVPYSLLNDAHASVSVPLNWEEIKENPDPRTFTIQARARLNKQNKDPFKDLLKKKTNSTRLLKKLKETYGFLL